VRLSPDIRIPDVSVGAAVTAIRDEFRRHATQVNLISEGRVDSHHNARSSIPTGPGKSGDIVWKSPVVEAGAPGSKYVVVGFVCITSGDPGIWREMRVLTGS
jgi:hypothetical protein